MTTRFKQTLALLALLFVFSAIAQSPFSDGHPAPGMNALFQQTNGWIGGDGVSSVPLPRGAVLWLFSDTWVGTVFDGKRTNVTMVNNTLALQEGHGANGKMRFVIRHNAENKPVAFVTPDDQRGWFWFEAGTCIGNRLFLSMAQIDKTGAPGVFGFRQIGQSLGIVTNPLAPPLEWHIEQLKLPCAEFSANHNRIFGNATLVDGQYLYIYGIDEDLGAGKLDRYLTVSRVPTNQVADFSAWRYYANGQWDADFHKATRIANHMATDFSVTLQKKLGQFVLVYTDRGLSPKIQVRASPHPWGEWSEATTVYRCPEMSRDKRLFSYGAKAHPTQVTDDALMIDYVVNSYDVSQVINDASLYWPRFVRVSVATSGASMK